MRGSSWERVSLQTWEARAACRHEGSACFYPRLSESAKQQERRENEAKQICAGCPVRVECLDYAITTRQALGVWGGLNEAERRTLIRAIA